MSLIEFDQVSKRFGLEQQQAGSFQELLVKIFKSRKQPKKNEFWALRDVSFNIDRGQTIGFIGSNGAGKSSVLKLISRILVPTTGHIRVNGRVSALLELGSGFHPELTGRENIFLNGSIMGIDRSELVDKFEEIVAFAELEKFIDVPVKYYSSGMYVRLGFSVAVHTRPEIFLVDEVLAVGDQEFQRKCLQRITQLKHQGVTIVLVSHNLSDVETLCDRAIWIRDGQIAADGPAMSVVDQYRSFSNRRFYKQEDSNGKRVLQQENRWGTQDAVITDVDIMDAQGQVTNTFHTGDYFHLRIHYSAPDLIDCPAFGFAFYREDGLHINGPNSVREGYDIPYIQGKGYVDYVIDRLPLNEGKYELTVAIYNRNSTLALDHHHRAYPINVTSPSYWREEGIIHIPAHWHHIAHS